MNIAIDKCQVNMCNVPAFMGHEELVLPMLVLGSSEGDKADKLGGFRHCMNERFQPNDLSNTAVVGYASGMSPVGVNLDRIFVWDIGGYRHMPEIVRALDVLDIRYAFFMETSKTPLQDGFVHRCRFVARDMLTDFYPQLDAARETEQKTAAHEVISAFFQSHCDTPDYKAIYGDHFNSRMFRTRFGDDEQFSIGYAIWLESEGVVRAWTRITYVPK